MAHYTMVEMFIFGQGGGTVLGVIHSHSRERNKGEVDGKRELVDLERGRGSK